MKAELTGKNISYNMLGCPHCSNLLYDSLNLYERNKEYKTVACTCCDFIGVRKGYVLLSLEEQKQILNSNTKCQNQNSQLVILQAQ